MAIHVEILADINDRELQRQADELARRLDAAGQSAGSSYTEGFAAGAIRSSPQVQKAFSVLENATTRATQAQRAYDAAQKGGNEDAKTKASERLAIARRAEGDAHRAAASALRGFSEATRAATDSSDEASQVFTDLSKAMTGVGRVAVPAMIGGLVALAPVIADVIGVAASAAQSIALLPAAAATAGSALLTLKLATDGLDQALKDIRDPSKLAADLSNLSPAAQSVATSIRELLPEFDRLRFATQDAIFNNVGPKLQELSAQFLPAIQTLTTGVGSAFNEMFSSVSAQLMTPQIQGDLKAIIDNVTSAFHELAPAVAPVTQALADLTATGSDFLPDLARSISDAAQEFANFVRSARDSGKLSEFMQDGLTTLKELGDLAKNVTELFFGFSNEKSRDDLALFSAAIKGIAEHTDAWITSLRVLRDLLFPIVGAMDAVITLGNKLGVIDLPSGADYTAGHSPGDPAAPAALTPSQLSAYASALPNTVNSIGLGTNAFIHSPVTGGWTPAGSPFADPNAKTPKAAKQSDKDRRDAIEMGLDPSLWKVDPYAGMPAGGPGPMGAYGGSGYGVADPQQVLEAQHNLESQAHDLEESRKKRLALERDNTATAKEIEDAKWQETKDGWALQKAQAELVDKQNGTSKKLKEGVDQLGAALDPDFGLSKGLPGFAENLVKFLGDIALAPEMARLDAISKASPIQGGYGLLGIHGAENMANGLSPLLGRPFTAGGLGGPGGGAPGYTGGAAGGYPGDAALLSAIPSSGRYDATGDLAKGLADCSSGVEDLVDLLDGKSTAGRTLTTGTAASVLPGLGFLPGEGGPGDFRIGYNSHHMQATLPGGTPVNYGNPNGYTNAGAGGAGADDPALTQHYYRPAGASGGAALGSAGGSPFGLGSSGATPVYVVNMPGDGGIALPGMPTAGGLQGAVGGPGGTPGADWDKMAQSEAGGNWAKNSGNGFSGGLQFTPSTWNANKPAGAPDQAWQATREQQIAAAENVLKTQGPGAWPSTFTPLGITGTHAPDLGTGRSGYDPNHPAGGGNFNPDMRIDTSTTSVSPPSTAATHPQGGSLFGFKGSPDRSPYAGLGGSISTPATGWEYPIGLPPFHGASPTTGSGGLASTFGQVWNDPTRPTVQLPPGSSPASASSGGLASASGQVWNDPTRPTFQGGSTPIPPIGLPAIPGQGGTPAGPGPGSIGPFPTPIGVGVPGSMDGPPLPPSHAPGGAGSMWGGAPGGNAPNPTPIGGLAPSVGAGGPGGIGITPGGTLDTALGLGAAAFPGVGQAAQTAVKLGSRAIQYAGQLAGIGVSGLMETFLPTGGSELANNGWFTRIIGGLAGAKPALPNIAGGKNGGNQAQPPLTPEQATSQHLGTGAPPGPNVHVEYNSVGQTEDQNGKHLAYQLEKGYQPAGGR